MLIRYCCCWLVVHWRRVVFCVGLLLWVVCTLLGCLLPWCFWLIVLVICIVCVRFVVWVGVALLAFCTGYLVPAVAGLTCWLF